MQIEYAIQQKMEEVKKLTREQPNNTQKISELQVQIQEFNTRRL